MIHVTKTYLPDLEEYNTYLQQIWDKSWVTNNGPLVRELESKLKEYLGVKHLLFCSNGTIVLQMAIKALGISKEIITTPFSYCATVTAPIWEQCTPIFADINPSTLCIDPQRMEAVITENTQAILATHVYGNPCELDVIQNLADKHKLKVIYDAAHAFGVNVNGQSLLSYGDVSTCSFHATKVFHTIEGGAIITNDDDLAHQFSLLRSFGHVNDDYFVAGINAKNSEFHAAMGLCVLPKMPQIYARRKEIFNLYDQWLPWSKLTRPYSQVVDFQYNYAYYPVLFESETALLNIMEALKKYDIFPRRYFYPSLNTLPYLPKSTCPVSEDLALRVLCLPLYFDLANEDIEKICNIIRITL